MERYSTSVVARKKQIKVSISNPLEKNKEEIISNVGRDVT